MILSASATKITSENRARIYKTDDKKEEEEEEEEEERKDAPTATERESARKLVVYLLIICSIAQLFITRRGHAHRVQDRVTPQRSPVITR
jgi:hypothetical protein